MTCFHPMPAVQLEDGGVTFVARGTEGKSKYARAQNVVKDLTLPCGQCVGCRIDRSRQWAVRCVHESQMHEHSSFVTLTYNDDNLPVQGQLVYRHFQLFMKRLRERLRVPVRYYMCGEYGDATWRPHYHALLFGAFFFDREYLKKSKSGMPLYSSKLLDDIWQMGDCQIGDVTYQSAAYCSAYVLKKIGGRMAEGHYERFDPITGEIFQLEPEFSHMSLKPGIGMKWFEKYHTEVSVVDGCYLNGGRQKSPRAYDRLLKVMDTEKFELMEYDRYLNSLPHLADSTVDRLRAREICARARSSLFQRDLGDGV